MFPVGIAETDGMIACCIRGELGYLGGLQYHDMLPGTDEC